MAIVSHLEQFHFYILNLLTDVDRHNDMSAQLRRLNLSSYAFIEGVNGRALPSDACFRLVGDQTWAKNRGTIGCFLSHVVAWERISLDTSESLTVVLEDDVSISSLPELTELDIPDDAELIFLNDRASESSHTRPLAVTPFREVIGFIDRMKVGLGGDGYLLTRSGAAKLIDACKKDGYYGHVDGRLLRYATSQEDLASLPEDGWIASIIRNHHSKTNVPLVGILKAYGLSSPVVRHRGLVSSRASIDAGL